MSHGGGKITREIENQVDRFRRAGADDFGRAASKIAAAQICQSLGFQGSKESALDTLAEIVIVYLSNVGKMASFYSNLAGRTECNVFDIVRGLKDLEALGSSQDAEVSRCLAGSRSIQEILEYMYSVQEIPFAQPVPQFPIIKNCNVLPSFIQMRETPPSKHIPNWLPAFPDSHTYIYTPVWNKRTTDPRTDKIEQAKQRRKAEKSLLSLQQRLVVDTGNIKEELPILNSNTSHDSELKPRKDAVSVAKLPLKHSDHVFDDSGSVLEAFAPVIEAVKGSGFYDDEEGEKKDLPTIRHPVQFKFKTGKKLLGDSLDLNIQKKGISRTTVLVGRYDERDDRKRRAEYILRKSMENPQELNQL
ncbi:transcription initiation factor TFIID subunit 8-like isoform X1 [Cucurbita maxima]|uniref:Transcription initiation factor TFIID subunit 8 n=1 Tax=Cucurbita maxima TaxID=3661 RepID=A0A6J1I6M5_CUCMA|nr:transcription initiation factor TFIID subunit 8-like isoform X1 [Cucurbita maxima]XP_022972682.1 transcription initiation factor TFIID subunit 8-like isoform X1 [Cucurbita maxima]